ncbi:Hypothetical predicted protein [Podarcis lilfordi]|nr:Hypothetical predicted protein [Podarcis lilfordi]
MAKRRVGGSGGGWEAASGTQASGLGSVPQGPLAEAEDDDAAEDEMAAGAAA